MTLNDYQKAAERTSGDLTAYQKVQNGCYGMCGEAGGIPSLTEQSAVIWCILNWCDRDGESIIYEVTYPNRFQGYRANNPEPEYLRELVVDVLTRWQREKEGETDVGRTLPSNYYFFNGDGKHNHFRTEWKAPYVTWDWSLPSPYES